MGCFRRLVLITSRSMARQVAELMQYDSLEEFEQTTGGELEGMFFDVETVCNLPKGVTPSEDLSDVVNVVNGRLFNTTFKGKVFRSKTGRIVYIDEDAFMDVMG